MFSAIASASFLPSTDGGLTGSLPTPCRSLLLRIPSVDGQEAVLLGVVITTDDGGAIGPAVDLARLRLDFWADEAEIHVSPGVDFALCYPTRVVARGTILDFAPPIEP